MEQPEDRVIKQLQNAAKEAEFLIKDNAEYVRYLKALVARIGPITLTTEECAQADWLALRVIEGEEHISLEAYKVRGR